MRKQRTKDDLIDGLLCRPTSFVLCFAITWCWYGVANPDLPLQELPSVLLICGVSSLVGA